MMKNTIGENIKIMRRKCGFTQEELATRLSVTPQAISKWENGNGTPDISQLVPLSQVFGITTDSLLGVVSATYGDAHTEAALGHEQLLMSTSQPLADKHLAAYTYFRAESEKEPSNYTIMRKCIAHGAEISRHADFDGYLSDKPEMLTEIFADCEHKNQCISRYCEDRVTIEKANYCMIWIYIHIREFDKAKKLIDQLPSLESNNLQESILTKYIKFQYGFEQEEGYILDNLRKLLHATGKEFFYSLEDYAWHATGTRAIEFGEKLLGILEAYKAFDHIRPQVYVWENELRKFLPKSYAAIGDFDKAGAELVTIARNYAEIASGTDRYKDWEEAKAAALKDIQGAVDMVEEKLREELKEHASYAEALKIVEDMSIPL